MLKRSPPPKFQTPDTPRADRGDHVWAWSGPRGCYLCVLCGGVTGSPPPAPTDEDWMPDKYVRLGGDERALSPMG